jgi:hypothetical protein
MLFGAAGAAASACCVWQVLGQLAPVPATFLKQLATDAELFDELPRSVQRQVRDRCPDRKIAGSTHPLACLGGGATS